MCEEKIQVYGKKSTGSWASKLFFCLCPRGAVSLGSTLNGATRLTLADTKSRR
jgi:hypothetical protein